MIGYDGMLSPSKTQVVCTAGGRCAPPEAGVGAWHIVDICNGRAQCTYWHIVYICSGGIQCTYMHSVHSIHSGGGTLCTHVVVAHSAHSGK